MCETGGSRSWRHVLSAWLGCYGWCGVTGVGCCEKSSSAAESLRRALMVDMPRRCQKAAGRACEQRYGVAGQCSSINAQSAGWNRAANLCSWTISQLASLRTFANVVFLCSGTTPAWEATGTRPTSLGAPTSRARATPRLPSTVS